MIAFAGKQRFGFKIGNVNVRDTELTLQLFQEVFPLLGIGLLLREVNIGLKVAACGSELFVSGDLLLGALAVAENALRGFLIAPEIRIGDAGFQRLQALAVARRVKDNSARG